MMWNLSFIKEEDFINVIKEKNIDTLIDATHPFAAVATETAIESCEKARINYIRYERASTILPDSDLIYKVPSFSKGALKAKELLKEKNDKLMHLAGVMTLHEIVKEVNPQQVIARVLPNTFSITKTQKNGIPAENIIAMQGTFSKEFNISLMKEYSVSAIITKESGESGGAGSGRAFFPADLPGFFTGLSALYQFIPRSADPQRKCGCNYREAA